MPSQDFEETNPVDPALTEHRARLLALARRNLNPVLAKRVSPEDVVQETLAAACRKTDFMQNCPDIPVYCKLRRLLFQTISPAVTRAPPPAFPRNPRGRLGFPGPTQGEG